MTLLRFASFTLDDEGVLWRPPGPTEAGRFNSCGDSEVVAVAATEDDGSIGDRSVGRAWIAWACIKSVTCRTMISPPFPI